MDKTSVRLIDNLAEVTSHQNTKVLEKSLLKTLTELLPTEDIVLYEVLEQEKGVTLNVISHAIAKQTTSKSNSEPDNIELFKPSSLLEAVQNQQVFIQSSENAQWNVFYPISSSNNNVFAVLSIVTGAFPSEIDKKLVSALLRVYSNYLGLLEKTQKDTLTGLFNRETLNYEISKILSRQNKSFNFHNNNASTDEKRRDLNQNKYWLGIIDIDHFKAINDTFGHLYGDEVLILVSRQMRKNLLRDDDLVFRYGGEEFVILLSTDTDIAAKSIFDRVRCQVSSHTFPQIEQVTISIGFVEIATQSSVADVIGQADKALYMAKENGRNRVEKYLPALKNPADSNQAHDDSTFGDFELF